MVKTCGPNARRLGFMPGQGTRSHIVHVVAKKQKIMHVVVIQSFSHVQLF